MDASLLHSILDSFADLRAKAQRASTATLPSWPSTDGVTAARPLMAGATLALVGILALGLTWQMLADAAPVREARLRAPEPALRLASAPAQPAAPPAAAAQPATAELATEEDAQRARLVLDTVRRQPQVQQHVVTVAKGDTLAGMLGAAGIAEREVYLITQALKKEFDPRKIREGQEVTLTIERPRRVMTASLSVGSADLGHSNPGGDAVLQEFAIKTDIDRFVRVRRDEDGAYEAFEDLMELERHQARAHGVIETSLYVAAKEAGVPDSVIAELMRMYAYDIDFQRGIRVGDEFEVFYTYYADDKGEAVKLGEVLYGSLVTSGEPRKLYRYTPSDTGVADYFDAKGASAKKFLMKTPIDGARMSSGFGMRKHPILGYSKMHKGIDFAAPTGTPIYAAGDGVVDMAGRNGSYGNYVRIAHANGYKTAYAHMKGFGKGITKGARVRQGQIIGYVGTTGRSTGPHLHYEVLVKNAQVNPLALKIPTGRKLEGKQLTAFQESASKLDIEIAATPLLGQEPETKLAKAAAASTSTE